MAWQQARAYGLLTQQLGVSKFTQGRGVGLLTGRMQGEAPPFALDGLTMR